MKKMRRETTGDRTLEAIQNNVESALSDIHKHPVLSGTFHEIELDGSEELVINHGLGRKYKYFNIVSRTAGAVGDVYLSNQVNVQPDKQILLSTDITEGTIIIQVM